MREIKLEEIKKHTMERTYLYETDYNDNLDSRKKELWKVFKGEKDISDIEEEVFYNYGEHEAISYYKKEIKEIIRRHTDYTEEEIDNVLEFSRCTYL